MAESVSQRIKRVLTKTPEQMTADLFAEGLSSEIGSVVGATYVAGVLYRKSAGLKPFPCNRAIAEGILVGFDSPETATEANEYIARYQCVDAFTVNTLERIYVDTLRYMEVVERYLLSAEGPRAVASMANIAISGRPGHSWTKADFRGYMRERKTQVRAAKRMVNYYNRSGWNNVTIVPAGAWGNGEDDSTLCVTPIITTYEQLAESALSVVADDFQKLDQLTDLMGWYAKTYGFLLPTSVAGLTARCATLKKRVEQLAGKCCGYYRKEGLQVPPLAEAMWMGMAPKKQSVVDQCKRMTAALYDEIQQRIEIAQLLQRVKR